jgi:ubiquinone/menaquinone biosynthesis C-methylase UbiE
MQSSKDEKEYILGTHDEEIWRLGLQHRVWRGRTLEGWRHAGFSVDQTIVDVGCGPGYATLDLAEIVGPSGRVIALDRSRRFLNALEAVSKQRGLPQISTLELDLDTAKLPELKADGAWVRWVFCFVTNPRDLLVRIAETVRPGGALVIHEYFDYSTWRLVPRCVELEKFVLAVMQSWRANGGEPDIGLDLVRWLEELNFEIQSVQPFVDIVTPSNFVWQWPKAFVRGGVHRLVELGFLTLQESTELLDAFTAAESNPNTRLVTPAVLEVIAIRR